MNAIELNGVSKRYNENVLDNVGFFVERGTVTGLIGENGAGKSTLIKIILGITSYHGKAVVLGKSADNKNNNDKKRLGAVLGDRSLPAGLTVTQFANVLAHMYGKSWNGAAFFRLAEKFGLPSDRAIGEFSTGMRVKCALAAAMSHGAELLVLDEPTSGLDPVARNEMLGVLYDFMQDENHTVLISSHITGDLEKLCDRIVFLHKGRVLLSGDKDELLYRYSVVRGADTTTVRNAVRVIERAYGTDALVLSGNAPSEAVRAGLDDIMDFYIRGKEQ